jgi:hypothetical protein
MKKRHWMYKLTQEERSHYAQYIKSKEGMRANLAVKDGRGFPACLTCVHIAHKLGWLISN